MTLEHHSGSPDSIGSIVCHVHSGPGRLPHPLLPIIPANEEVPAR